MEYVKLSTELILSTSEGENVVKKRNENRLFWCIVSLYLGISVYIKKKKKIALN